MATERMGKYWICDVCASARGWMPFKTGNTISYGLCSWCTRSDEVGLTPLRDLKSKQGQRADCEEDQTNQKENL